MHVFGDLMGGRTMARQRIRKELRALCLSEETNTWPLGISIITRMLDHVRHWHLRQHSSLDWRARNSWLALWWHLVTSRMKGG